MNHHYRDSYSARVVSGEYDDIHAQYVRPCCPCPACAVERAQVEGSIVYPDDDTRRVGEGEWESHWLGVERVPREVEHVMWDAS